MVIAREDDGDIEVPLLEVARHDKGIAAVIARPGENQDGLAGTARRLARDFRRRKSGSLHKLRACGRCHSRGFDGAHVRAAIDRRVMGQAYGHKCVYSNVNDAALAAARRRFV